MEITKSKGLSCIPPKFCLCLQKPYYFTGEILTVFVNLLLPSETHIALHLTICGTESCCSVEHTGSSLIKTPSSLTLFKSKISHSSTLPEGQHSLPFSLSVPKRLPSSAIFKHFKLSAQTSYTISAKIRCKYSEDEIATALLHSTQDSKAISYSQKTREEKMLEEIPVILHTRPDTLEDMPHTPTHSSELGDSSGHMREEEKEGQKIESRKQDEKSNKEEEDKLDKEESVSGEEVKLVSRKKVKGMMWKGKGECGLQVNLQRDVVFINEHIKGNVVVDNGKCGLNVKKIKLKLYELLKIKSPSAYLAQAIYEKEILILQEFLSGVKKGQCDKIGFSIPVTNQDLATSLGTILRKTYFLRIKPVFDGVLFSKKPCVIVPIFIAKQPPTQYSLQELVPPFAKEQEWNPFIHETISMKVESKK